MYYGPGRSATGGFTLTELLVVIGIAVVLMAIMIPAGKSLNEGNKMLTCKAQLQQIGQALRMYYADEHGVPPYYIAATEDASATPHGEGLVALYETGFLTRELTMHCPRDVETSADSDAFMRSYMVKGEVSALTELNKYPYLSFRGVTDETDANYRRQLSRGRAPVGSEVSAVPVFDPTWRPADDTVVTWCPFHAESVSMGGQGVYNLLFWDGSVVRVTEDVMTDSGVGPDEAWKITRDDSVGSSD